MVGLTLLCTDGSGQSVTPDTTPVATIYDAAGSRVQTILLPAVERYRATGLFAYPLQLGTAFSVGRYQVAISYKQSGVGRLKVAGFEVTAGDPAGAIVSMYSLERPHATYLVQRTDAGNRVFGRNPSV